MRIGIIDSGRGGLHISSLLTKKFGCETVQRKPIMFRSYSEMTMYDLIKQCDLHIEYLLKEKVDVIVIGCMTLSTNLSKYIKDKVNVPVFDLYEGLPKFSRDTLILCTTNTARSSLFNDYIVMPCPDVSSAIENGYELIVPGLIREYQSMIRYVNSYNRVILGCSHYSAAKQIFADYYLEIKNIIDPVDYLINVIDKSFNNSSLYRT